MIGEATSELHLTLEDSHFGDQPIDMPLDVLLGKTPKMTRDVTTQQAQGTALVRDDISLADAVKRVMHLPGVAEKTFLITIGDRSVTAEPAYIAPYYFRKNLIKLPLFYTRLLARESH